MDTPRSRLAPAVRLTGPGVRARHDALPRSDRMVPQSHQGAFMKDRIYRYIVRVDSGAAPNPFGGWCSLAICKPAIRRTAQRGDWIIGLRSHQPDHVIYV